MTKAKTKIVAIDGPAGSGKSSISARVAAEVGWSYVNTGALYRAVGLLVDEAGIDMGDDAAVARYVDEIGSQLRWIPETGELYFGERNLSPELGSEKAGRGASVVAKLPLVRDRLLPIQRAWALAAPEGAFVDGRDIGTVVFPDADLKIFLTASLEERARRRLAQLGGNHADESAALADIRAEIARRDDQDAGRQIAPLRKASDAVELDTSSMDIAEVIQAVVTLLKQKNLL